MLWSAELRLMKSKLSYLHIPLVQILKKWNERKTEQERGGMDEYFQNDSVLSSSLHPHMVGKTTFWPFMSVQHPQTLSPALLSLPPPSFLIRKHSCCPAVVCELGRPVFIKRKAVSRLELKRAEVRYERFRWNSRWNRSSECVIQKGSVRGETTPSVRKWLEKLNTVGLEIKIQVNRAKVDHAHWNCFWILTLHAWACYGREWYRRYLQISTTHLRFWKSIHNIMQLMKERKQNTSVRWQKNLWRGIWFITKVTKDTPLALDISSQHYYRLIRGAFKAGSNYEEWLGLIRRRAETFKYSECQNNHSCLFHNTLKCLKETNKQKR